MLYRKQESLSMFHSCRRLTWSWWSRSCMSWVRSAASRLASSSLALLAIASRHPSCIHSFTHSLMYACIRSLAHSVIFSLPVVSVYSYIQSYKYTVPPSGSPPQDCRRTSKRAECVVSCLVPNVIQPRQQQISMASSCHYWLDVAADIQADRHADRQMDK